jgi:ice-binding like protein
MSYSIVERRPGARRSRALSAILLALGSLVALAFAGSAMGATQVPLGSADSFGALSAAAMTNSGGNTVVNGDIGSSTSIDVGVTNGSRGSKYLAGSLELASAQASLLIAYNAAAAASPDQPTITGANLAGQTLGPGVYNSSSSILISGPVPLTLDGNYDPNAVFIFQAGSSLTVAATSSVRLTNGAQACNVFWQVGSSAFLLNSGGVFTGTILALTQITLTDGITVEGRVLARNADVTFIHDVVNAPTCSGSSLQRELYCDPAGKAYDLLFGEDKRPPYDQLGLVPAYLDPVTGARSCAFPVVATPPVVPPVTPPVVPTSPTPAETAAAVKKAKAAAAKVKAAKATAAKAKAKARAAAAKRLAVARAANSTSVGSARPAVRRVGLTG